MNDVLGFHDQKSDPIVAVTSYGLPHHAFLRTRETYETIPYSDGRRLVKRIITPRAQNEPIVITVRCDDCPVVIERPR